MLNLKVYRSSCPIHTVAYWGNYECPENWETYPGPHRWSVAKHQEPGPLPCFYTASSPWTSWKALYSRWHHVEVPKTNHGVQKYWYESQFCYLLAVWMWSSYLTWLRLWFLTCEGGDNYNTYQPGFNMGINWNDAQKALSIRPGLVCSKSVESPDLSGLKHSGLNLEEVDFGLSEEVWSRLGMPPAVWEQWLLASLSTCEVSVSSPLFPGCQQLVPSETFPSTCEWQFNSSGHNVPQFSFFSLLILLVNPQSWVLPVDVRGCDVISFPLPHAMEFHENGTIYSWEIKIHLLSSGSWYLRAPW